MVHQTHFFSGQSLLLETLLRRDPLLLQVLLFKPSILLLRLLFGGNALFLLEPFLLPEVLLGRPGQLDALALLGLHEALPLGAEDAILLLLIPLLQLALELGLLGGGGQPFGEAGGLLPELLRGLPGGSRQTFGQSGLLDGLPLLLGQGLLLKIELGGGLPLFLDPLLLLQLVPGGLDVGLC